MLIALAVATVVLYKLLQAAIMKRTTSNSNELPSLDSPNEEQQSPEGQQQQIQQQQQSGQNKVADHVLELLSSLFAVDGQFVSVMREREPMNTARLLRMLLRKVNGSADPSIPLADEDLAFLSLGEVLPKCDNSQINEIAEFLLTTQQIEQLEKEGFGDFGDGQAQEHVRIDRDSLEWLPFDTLNTFLAQNSVDKVGDDAARALRDQLMEAGIFATLLDALSFYSEQPNRYCEKDKQLGTIQFQAPSTSPRPSSSQQSLLRTPKNKRPKPTPATARGARGGRGRAKRGAVMIRCYRGRGRGACVVAGSSQQAQPEPSEAELDEDYWARRAKERCIEAILKGLNSFLLDAQLVGMASDWLGLLFRSSFRNFVRASLMNGDLAEVVHLSPTYGAMFQLLSTLANSIPVYVKNMATDIYAKPASEQNGTATPAMVQPFDLVLGEDPEEHNNTNSNSTSTAAGSSSTSASTSSSASAPASAQPVLEHLRQFGGKIDDHCKLLMNAVGARGQNGEEDPDNEEDGAEGEELVTLCSLSSLCEAIIRTVAQTQQNSTIHQQQQQGEGKSSSAPSSSSDTQQSQQSAKSMTTAKTYDLRKSGPGTHSSAQNSVNSAAGTSFGNSSFAQQDEELAKRYCQTLKELQFATIPFDAQPPIPHHFRSKFGAGSSMGMANLRIKRIGKELFALRSDLPLTMSSAVFVRTSEEHMDALKVLITGPADTPYESGCYEFDFFLNADFPTKPPQVQFMTTGNGSVRFNPNLYNCGKVCLSLLGTWPGDNKAQEWNANNSSISQVITSIQGLILVPDPYYNEPGYEKMKAKSEYQQQNVHYNLNIQLQNLRWAIIEQMRNPPRGFEEVVRKHFWLKRDHVMAQINNWAKQNVSVQGMHGKLEEEFKKLEKTMAAQMGQNGTANV